MEQVFTLHLQVWVGGHCTNENATPGSHEDANEHACVWVSDDQSRKICSRRLGSGACIILHNVTDSCLV